MHSPKFKPEIVAVNVSPFNCHKIPFICRNTGFIIPFIGLNKPSVGSDQNLSGFTLIELLVTLAVVSILSFVAVPSIKNILKDHRLSGYTNDLVADLNFARSEAVKRATPVTVCKTLTPQAASPTCNSTAADAWTTGRITFVDTDSDGVIDSGEQILRIRQALDDQNSVIKGTGATTANGTLNRMTFRGDGTRLIADASATIYTQISLCDDRGAAQKRTLDISYGGRIVSLQKGTGTITCP